MVDWGLNVFMNMNHVSASHYFAAIARESRVRAIQAIIQESNFDKVVKVNPLIEKFAHCYLPYKKLQTINHLYEWHEHMFEITYKTYNKDMIQFEWKKRIDFISNHIESQKDITNV